jgi:hypothetical protein
MRYTVVYKPSAEQELAQSWMAAPDRQAVTEAANRVDALLATDPLGCGESRSGATRVLFEPPLMVFYEVREEDRLVEVLKVRRVPG